MDILLYDVDSVIPNLAIMKLSTYYKNQGNNITFIRGDRKPINVNYENYDMGYASVVFTNHRDLIQDFPFEIGGTGFSFEINLPEEIEHQMPDYSLYPENKYSLGFTTRGCVRTCGFCFVPRKEGLLKFNADLEEFYNPKFPKIMLLDNNIFAYKDYEKIFDQIRKINKPTCFKQGMDFRLLDDKKVDNLLSIKYDKEYIFAYDDLKLKPIIMKQMNKYRERFPDYRLKFFVLVGYNSSISEDIERVMYLRELKCLPYIMRYESCYSSPYKDFYTDLAAWCNQVFAFKKLDFEEFLYRRYTNQKRIDYSLNVWKENIK
jgi:hypothetical protein